MIGLLLVAVVGWALVFDAREDRARRGRVS